MDRAGKAYGGTGGTHSEPQNLIWDVRKITRNSIEVDAETKDSTRKTEEKLDGRYKEGHERKKPK